MNNFMRLLALVLLLCTGQLAQAQQTKKKQIEDVVHLKNGTIIRGIIIEQVPNVSYKIQQKDRSIQTVAVADIEKITKENIPDAYFEHALSEFGHKRKGYLFIAEVMYSGPAESVRVGGREIKNADSAIGLKITNAYQASEFFAIGLGAGLEQYNKASLLPLTLDMRTAFAKGMATPTFNAAVGYALPISGGASYGLIINPSVGFRAYLTENLALHGNVGYKWLEQSVKYSGYYSGSGTQKTYFKFFTVSTGLSF